MEWFKSVLVVIQIITAIGVIILVLVQQGKGADMGAAFGGGSSGGLFGATGSANFLSRLTAAFATIFFVVTLGITYLSSKKSENAGVLSGTSAPTPVTNSDIAPAAPKTVPPSAVPGQNIPK